VVGNEKRSGIACGERRQAFVVIADESKAGLTPERPEGWTIAWAIFADGYARRGLPDRAEIGHRCEDSAR